MRHINILKNLLNLNRHHISPDMDIALKELSDVYEGYIDEYFNDQSALFSKFIVIIYNNNNNLHLYSKFEYKF